MGLQKESWMSRYFYPVGCAMIGIGTPIITNYSLRRPLYSSIYRHVGFGIVGYFVGVYADRYLEKRWEHRDAVIKHYIELHPEDFVEHKRKYKEIFDEWFPIR